MANSTDVKDMLIKAQDRGTMVECIVIGRNDQGTLEVFSPTANKDTLITLLDALKTELSK